LAEDSQVIGFIEKKKDEGINNLKEVDSEAMFKKLGDN
jgi:hypothetical protein